MSEEQKPASPHLRKILLTILTLFFLLCGALYFLYWWFDAQYYESTTDAYVSGNLVQVMPQITGHVTAILADETDLVKKGQPLVTLDKADAEIALKNAEAQLAVTVRQVSQYYKDVDQAKANVQVQQENLIKAQADLKRRESLPVNEVISAEDLQHAKIAADSAAASFELAQQQLAAAIEMVANSDLYHHPQILEAAINLRNAYLNWQRTTIFAPETGYIANRSVQVGEEVNPSTALMVIVPLNQLWVDANFKESQLGNIRINQPVDLTSDVYGSKIKYRGTIIGLSPGTGSTFDLLPPQNATGNWIKIVQRVPVRISLDQQQLKQNPLRMGLSMLVTVDTHNRNGASLTRIPTNQVIYETQNYGSDLKAADDLIQQILQSNAPDINPPNANP